MNEINKNELSEANAKARGVIRLIVGVVIGIISAKRHEWITIANYLIIFLFIEATFFYIIVIRKFFRYYRSMAMEWSRAFNMAYNIAHKIVWIQIFLSLLFVGAVSSITKLITNIFI